jgi:tetratricopeptide (TPR) repeat protein
MLRKFVSFLLLSLFFQTVHAQMLTTIADGGNKKASVSELIGITDVSIHYDRPAVKKREGKIWGELVPYGFTDLGFGTSKAAPWRAGANENTSISFSTDVQVEGKFLPAGTYALFMAMAPAEATLIFSKNHTSWGSYFYDPKEDALRVTVKTIPTADSRERLTYEFSDQQENSALITLRWEKLGIPFKVSVDYISTQLASYRQELRSEKGFRWEAWVEAIDFCIKRNVNLEEALQWSDYAMNAVFVGERNFRTFSARASVLKKLNRSTEADQLMKEAIPMGTMLEVHVYGRQLIDEKKYAEALQVFKINAEKNPGKFTPNMGLMRGHSANGDLKNALKYARLALPLAPENQKKMVEGFIQTLESGKEIN